MKSAAIDGSLRHGKTLDQQSWRNRGAGKDLRSTAIACCNDGASSSISTAIVEFMLMQGTGYMPEINRTRLMRSWD